MSNVNGMTATRGAAITPSDTGVHGFSSLYVGTAGNLRITTAAGDDITLAGISGFVPIQISRVWSTSTTASNIVGLSQ